MSPNTVSQSPLSGARVRTYAGSDRPSQAALCNRRNRLGAAHVFGRHPIKNKVKKGVRSRNRLGAAHVFGPVTLKTCSLPAVSECRNRLGAAHVFGHVAKKMKK